MAGTSQRLISCPTIVRNANIAAACLETRFIVQYKATCGNGTQLIFDALDAETVHAFYDAALRNGSSDDGPPGPQAYSPNYYGAYVRDPVDNKLNVSVIPKHD